MEIVYPLSHPRPDPTIHSLSDKIIAQSNVSKIISKVGVKGDVSQWLRWGEFKPLGFECSESKTVRFYFFFSNRL